ncbi:site-2 protease family protein [Novosphingobium terrae]|uniref:site-2 protease family protein n=1 Tax=Novosphingobium terrae TaxID=2726189 RepID=UPI00197FC030|nr:site-2 protease family protein [Novosphingobium terrae]
MSGALIHQIVMLAVPLIVAIVFHEVAHGWAARALGDPTARDAKRLSLNPLRHVDPIGTVVLPGLLALAHLPVFGWAKPVPVNKWRLRNPRVGMMLVAAAGPGSNIVMALIAALVLGPIGAMPLGPDTRWLVNVVELLATFIQINLFLAIFNLLPIPPFDGSHIVEGLLPAKAAEFYAKFRRLGFALVLVLLVLLPQVIPSFDPIGSFVGPPFEWLYAHVMQVAHWTGRF